MDQDDVSYPQRFEQQLQRLQSDPDLDLVAVQAVTISGTNKILGMLPWDDRQEEISAKPWRGFYLPHPTWMGKLSWFRKHRYAFPGPYFWEDQELLLRAYDKSHLDLIREPLFAYRLRDGFDIAKLVKTRASVLVVQLHHFIKNGQWRFAALSALTFFGRLAVDLFRTRLGRFLLIQVTEIDKMGRECVDSNQVFIDNLRIPVAGRIGEEGKGFEYILHGMNPERILIAAEAVGLGKGALARAAQYANERNVFERPIGQNQGIQHPLARSWIELEAANLMVFKAASLFDAGRHCGAEANAAKYLAGEACFRACENAILTHGGMGYAKEYHVERYLREAWIPRLAKYSTWFESPEMKLTA